MLLDGRCVWCRTSFPRLQSKKNQKRAPRGAGIATKFLTHGADINSVTANGLSSLMLAAKSGHDDIVKLLLRNKADTALRDDNKLNAIDHALASNNTIIASFVEAGGKR